MDRNYLKVKNNKSGLMKPLFFHPQNIFCDQIICNKQNQMRQKINDNKREDKDLINNTLSTQSELGKLELLYHQKPRRTSFTDNIQYWYRN